MNTIIILLLIFFLLSIPIFLYPSLTKKQLPPPPLVTKKQLPIETYVLNPQYGCEVYHNIYLGNAEFASDKQLLYNLKITHIVNAAKEIPDYFQGDNTFQYIHLNMDDVPEENASRFFEISREFIENALKNNGVVLIHCRAGVSRSVTILMYYLMKTLNISPQDSLKLIRKCRPIANPNPGFLKQLGYN